MQMRWELTELLIIFWENQFILYFCAFSNKSKQNLLILSPPVTWPITVESICSLDHPNPLRIVRVMANSLFFAICERKVTCQRLPGELLARDFTVTIHWLEEIVYHYKLPDSTNIYRLSASAMQHLTGITAVPQNLGRNDFFFFPVPGT